MFIKELFVSNLRNLEQQNLVFNSPVNFLSGGNGQGKTSVLEAIFILSHLRSFRSSSLKDVISVLKNKPDSILVGEKTAYIKVILELELGLVELEISLQGKNREILVNKKKVNSLDKFCGILKTVLFTPEDLEIVKGSPQIRRQFLDRVLAMFDPKNIILLNDYSKRHKFRNALLKSGDLNGSRMFIDQLIELNQEIVKRRLELVNLLKSKVGALYSEIAGDQEESFDLAYESAFLNNNTLLGFDEIKDKFLSTEKRDIVLGRSSLGCHRDELKIDLINDGIRTLSRTTASQGQTRTKVLSFKLASAELIHTKTGEWPVLLLDDVEAELDQTRSDNLFNKISSYKGQVFITGTKAPRDEISKNSDHFLLEKGKLKKRT